MIHAALLAVVGALEGVVWFYRMRSAMESHRLANAIWTAAVCALRILFIAAGVSAIMAENIWLALVAYTVPATASSMWAHSKKT